ncbi:hypothetical protein EDB86DRAFT_1581798 [Lactarius hatsudake]|nr:hypothetical protein EDB86DRAFT_1581798 [Lactarius hatsudake]
MTRRFYLAKVWWCLVVIVTMGRRWKPQVTARSEFPHCQIRPFTLISSLAGFGICLYCGRVWLLLDVRDSCSTCSTFKIQHSVGEPVNSSGHIQ